MNLLTLGWRGLLRRPLRSALTVAGVALASAALFSLLAFSVGYRVALNREMSNAGIHMFVSTEGCPMEAASLALHGGEIPKFLPEDRASAISKVPGVRAMTELLIFSVAGEGTRVDLFYGTDDQLPKLKKHWKVDGAWFKDEHSIVLGAEAARVEKRGVGDKIYFPEIDAEFLVSGVIERTGSEDDGFFYIPLKTAQHLFKKEGKLTGIGVAVDNIENIDEVKSEIETIPDVYVVTSAQMMQQILKLVGSSKALMFAVLGIALGVAVLGVLNTVLMSVMEKLREFGYFRCVGAAPRHIFLLVLCETLTLCLIGGVIGVLAGNLAASAVDTWIRDFLPFAPGGRMLLVEPQMIFATIGVAVGIGALAGLWPSWKASRVSPMEAIRYE